MGFGECAGQILAARATVKRPRREPLTSEAKGRRHAERRRPSTSSACSANAHHPAFQFMLLALCGLCLVIDGFDAQAMGYVAPSVIGEWHVSKARARPGIQREPVRHAARRVGAVGAGGPHRPSSGADRRDAVLRAVDARHAVRLDDSRVDRAALHHGARPRLHHAERDGARRRIFDAPRIASSA